jgi:hypothetical protein
MLHPSEAARLARFKPLIAAVSHTNYLSAAGGVERHLGLEERAALSRGLSYVHLYPFSRGPAAPGGETAFGLNIDGRECGPMAPDGVRDLFRLLEENGHGLAAFHVYHLKYHRLENLAALLEGRDTPVLFTVYDYHTLCGQVRLQKNDADFCGAPPPDSPDCAACAYGSGRAAHRAPLARFVLEKCTRWIAPSLTAAGIWLRGYPELAGRIEVEASLTVGERRGAPRPGAAGPQGKIRIGFLGHPKPYKGWEVWKRLAARLDPARYEFFRFSLGGESLPGVHAVPVPFDARRPEAVVQALTDHRIDMLLLWSTWPETFCFAAFEGMQAGCFVLTCAASGNTAAEVRQRECGKVFESEADLVRFLEDPGAAAGALAAHAARGGNFEASFNARFVEEALRSSYSKLRA